MAVPDETTIKDGKHYATIPAGSTITKIVDFVGGQKGGVLRVEPHLLKHGGTKGSWVHSRGETDAIDRNGNLRPAEVHWFEDKTVGQVGMKQHRV